MDIIASILAYLGCVTGVVAALAISFMVYFSPVAQPASAPHAVALAAKSLPAKSPPTKTVAEAEQKTVPTHPNNRVAPLAKNDATPAAVPTSDVRQKTKMSRAQWNKLVQNERARRLAYQQDPDFEARFLGYAD
jgi:hypothetical protein